MDKTKARATIALGLATIGIFAMNSKVAARTSTVTPLVAITRASELILRGTVLEVRPSTIIVQPKKVLKGALVTAPLEVKRPVRNHEILDVNVNYKTGNTVFVFTKNSHSALTSYASAAFLPKFNPEIAPQYEAAINTIIEYDVSPSTGQKHKLIYSMLKGENPFLKRAAMWELIVNDKVARESGIVKDDVLPILGNIALGSDSALATLATTAIGEIGGPKSNPILTNLTQSANHNVAETALTILRRQGQ